MSWGKKGEEKGKDNSWWNRNREEDDRQSETSRNTSYPSVQVGGRTMYPDNQGFLHSTPSGAVSEDMRTETDMSRGASGGCGQDPDQVP